MHDDPSDHDDQGLRKRVRMLVMVVVMVMVVTSTTVRQWIQGTGLLTQVDV